MIKVKVTAVLDMAALLGGRSRVWHVAEGSRIEDLLTALIAERGNLLAERLYLDGNGLRNDIHLFLNGRNIVFLDGLKTVLSDGDELLFIPPAGGG